MVILFINLKKWKYKSRLLLIFTISNNFALFRFLQIEFNYKWTQNSPTQTSTQFNQSRTELTSHRLSLHSNFANKLPNKSYKYHICEANFCHRLTYLILIPFHHQPSKPPIEFDYKWAWTQKPLNSKFVYSNINTVQWANTVRLQLTTNNVFRTESWNGETMKCIFGGEI